MTQPRPQPIPTGTTSPDSRRDGVSRRIEIALVLLFLLLTGLILTVGWIYLKHQQRTLRTKILQDLDTIATLKAQQIIHWRKERLQDARFFSNAAFVRQDVAAFLANPSSEITRDNLVNWLHLLKGGDRYEQVALFDADGNERLALVPWSHPPDEMILKSYLQSCLRSSEIILTDLHRGKIEDHIHIDILIPVLAPGAEPTPRPIGVILLQIDPRKFLYPLIQSWPTASRSAETLLARREGEEVLFLNELRHRTNTALRLRFPLTQKELPAVMAVTGRTGIVEGVDYRGVPVVAVLREVPETAWFMVAKVDRAEIDVPLRRQVLLVASTVGALLMAAAFGVGFLWRQRDATLLRRALNLKRQQEQLTTRLALVTEHTNDMMLMTTAEGQIVEANPRAGEGYGWPQEELRRKTITDLCIPTERARVNERLGALGENEKAVLETVHQRKDGSSFPAEMSVRATRIADARYHFFVIRDITERKAHEREIERLNRLYATLSQVNQSIVRAVSQEELLQQVCETMVTGARFKVVWIGRHDSQTHQVRPVASAGAKTYLEHVIFYADDRPEGRGPVGICLREGKPAIFNDFLNAPQSLAWREAAQAFELRAAAAFPIRFQGVVWGALTVYDTEAGVFQDKEIALLEEAALDISYALDNLDKEAKRRQAEEGRLLLATAVGQAAETIVVTDVNGAIQYVNPTFERVTGYSSAEVIGQNLRILKSGQQDERFYRDLWQTILSGNTWRGRFVNRRKDGSLYVEEAVISPVRDTAGRITNFVAVKHDVTEREQAARALRESEEKYHILFENSRDAFMTLATPSWQFTDVNAATVEMFRAGDKTALLAATPWQLSPEFQPDGRRSEEKAQEMIETALKKGFHFFEWQHKRFDGDEFPATILLTRFELNGVTMLQATLRDISAEKAAMKSLRETNERLDRALNELKQAQAKVLEQERLRIVGQMASGIAHDFNNALAPILGFCELLCENANLRKNDEKLREFLDLMRAAAKDAAEVVRRLRELYRKREDYTQFGAVNLTKLAQQAVMLTEPRWKAEAAAAGATIRFDLDLQPVPDILGSESALREILTNLILNAVDAMPQGGTIRLRCYADNQLVTVEVSDTGIGMSEEVRQHCFDPFFTTKGEKGTGLGLAMVDAIVRNHGGTIHIVSQPGEGATFTLRFPVANISNITEGNATGKTLRRRLRILLVDDKPMVSRAYSEFLRHEGHTVYEATNGQEGLAAFAAQPFDVVVTDMAMAGMGGQQLVERLQRQAPGTPVVLLTGFGDLIKTQSEKPPGVTVVLGKPATLKELQAAIEEAVKTRSKDTT